jgi:hypothetical protein
MFETLQRDIMPFVLPNLQVDDLLQLRKPHPCGSYVWKVYRLGADIGIQCQGCARRVMLPRRTIAKRLKQILTIEDENQPAS